MIKSLSKARLEENTKMVKDVSKKHTIKIILNEEILDAFT